MNYTGKGLIILGAGAMQGPAIRTAKEMGLTAIAVDGDPDAPCVPLADRFERIDLKDKEGVEALARALQAEGTLAGIMTAGTDFSATVAWVAERLGLPGIPYAAALNASDKERMRECFKAAGLPSPRFIILKAPASPEFALPFAYPAVVKPVDNMGARGCRRVNNPAELDAGVRDALAFSRSSRVIVEEYMEGPELSVDALVYNGKMTVCGVADRHIAFPPYFIEMGHTMPSALDPAAQEAVLRVFEAGAKALGITNGAAKGDMKLTPAGPMIGEIAARLSGGYMSGWTYPYSSGVQVTKGAIQIALGLPPDDLVPKRAWTSAERAIISIPGRVCCIDGRSEAGSVAGVKDLFMRIAPSKYAQFPVNNVTKCGNIIASAPDRESAIAGAEQAARMVLIRLNAPNPETEAFLAGAGADFPPDAFILPDRLRELLNALPKSAARTNGIVEPGLLPFPALLESDLRDYMGRTVAESVGAIRAMTGRSLAFTDKPPFFGREFWESLVRGGYQGGAYATSVLG
ncbi:MAG: ATP-grasp domain-containing protein [Spirochaetaceae bacterium]|jgi:biotin carboxylase|nr:ATP-grasp domain-containing protein [Spirochaetaceae bacterium]